MDSAHLAFLSISRVAGLLKRRKVSPLELVEAMLERIARLNPGLNAYVTIVADAARAAAQRAALEIRGGRYRGLLHGVPISLKDNVWTRGLRTTAGSKILANFVPQEDAGVARRLTRAGAILLGKTNLHEFAYGISTENPHYGATHNPWAIDRIAGGSSGGSAAALTAGLCWGSVGTDTGGSIRIPAALCGVVGLKPTYGRVSCYGVVPLARTLDHVGPLARSVEDVAILLGCIAGRDRRDPLTASVPVPDYARLLRERLRGFRLGWATGDSLGPVDGEIAGAIERAARVLERLGASIDPAALPDGAATLEASNQIAVVEARSDHERAGWFPARAEDYGSDVRKLLEIGGEVRATAYLHALEQRRKARAEFARLFDRFDALLMPTAPVAATPIGAAVTRIAGVEETIRSAMIRLNRLANFVGVPAISLPCGFTREGLPIGMQLIGPAWGEVRLLRIALAYQRATPWHLKRPPGT